MTYLRIDRNKFWGWVVVSLLVGIGLGVGTMFLLTASRSDDIRVANNRADAASAKTASAEASLTAVQDQNTRLTVDLESANAEIASLQPSTPTTPTDTPSTPATPTIAVTSRTITPSSPDESATITMTAKVTGSPTKVTMRIYNASKSFDHTYTLTKISTSGGTQTWRATTKAPATEGTYKYYATAIKGSAKVTMKGTSAATLTVKSD